MFEANLLQTRFAPDGPSALAASRLLDLDAKPSEDAFTPLERQVIWLAWRDDLSSIRAPGPLLRLLRRIFDIRTANSLADGRLEALRRFAVAARLGGRRRMERERECFTASGFSVRQADMVALAVAS